MKSESVKQQCNIAEQIATLLFDVLVEQHVSITDIVADYFGSGERPKGCWSHVGEQQVFEEQANGYVCEEYSLQESNQASSKSCLVGSL